MLKRGNMEVSALSSGSSGNCFYVRNNSSALLVDAGISAKKTVERLNNLGLSEESIKAIFITHEHADHVKGADVLARHLGIPIFATKKTAENCFLCSDLRLINLIRNDETVKIAGMSVSAFSKSHNAADPVSYTISNGKRISIITDLGYPCANVIEHVSNSDFLCLESNHDIKMLEEGRYPYFLKKWITSDSGHLSNLQSSLCVLEHANSRLKHIMLSHISENNNTPLLAFETFSRTLKERQDLKPKLTVSVKDINTPLFKL
jgi:phosphoribosyl 1,2-cyclic phosphodiesterase